MKKWLIRVCGLKPNAEDERFARGVDENNPPIPREERHYENLESDESSPTLSSSSPYIPISECFTGKPISFSETTNGCDTGYCNTSFPFPPKVNWATHPSKRESETTPSPRPIGLEAPPRPPKKKSPTYSPTEHESDLVGTYLQIDTNLTSNGSPHNHKHNDSHNPQDRSNSSLSHPHPPPKKPQLQKQPEEPGVEYKVIDHVKTKALNQMRQDRAEQLTRANPITKIFNNNTHQSKKSL